MTKERTSWDKGHNVGRFTESVVTGTDVADELDHTPVARVMMDESLESVASGRSVEVSEAGNAVACSGNGHSTWRFTESEPPADFEI